MFISTEASFCMKRALLQENFPSELFNVEGLIVAGGFPTEILLSNHPETYSIPFAFSYSDIDIYAETAEAATTIKTILSAKYEAEVSDWAITFKRNEYTNIQFITLTSGTAKEILSNFDFKNCAVAYKPIDNQLIYHEDLLHLHYNGVLDLLNSSLLELKENAKPNDIRRAQCTMARTVKYHKKYSYEISDNLENAFLELQKTHSYLFDATCIQEFGSVVTSSGKVIKKYDYIAELKALL